jgi:hypothetical protein
LFGGGGVFRLVRRSFSVEAKLNETEAKFFKLRSETDGLVYRLFRFEAKQQIQMRSYKGKQSGTKQKMQSKQ